MGSSLLLFAECPRYYAPVKSSSLEDHYTSLIGPCQLCWQFGPFQITCSRATLSDALPFVTSYPIFVW